MQTEKYSLYKTAKATIACALFDAGDYVHVRYSGNNWFDVSKDRINWTVYPHHHLSDFVL